VTPRPVRCNGWLGILQFRNPQDMECQSLSVEAVASLSLKDRALR